MRKQIESKIKALEALNDEHLQGFFRDLASVHRDDLPIIASAIPAPAPRPSTQSGREGSSGLLPKVSRGWFATFFSRILG